MFLIASSGPRDDMATGGTVGSSASPIVSSYVSSISPLALPFAPSSPTCVSI